MRASTPLLRAIPLLLAALVCIPGTADAQFDRVDRLWVASDGRVGGPFTIYNGTLFLFTEADSVPLQTLYRERVVRPVEGAISAGWMFGTLARLNLGLRVGSSPTEADFSGGGMGPQTFSRDLTWTGLDVSADFPIRLNRDWTLWLGGGAAHTRWSLDTGGSGRDAMAAAVGIEEPPRRGRIWTDRSWSTTAVFFATSLHYALSPTLDVNLTFRQSGLETQGSVFSSEISDDLRSVGASGFKITTDPDATRSLPFQVGVGVQWNPWERRQPDPGIAVIEMVAAGGELHTDVDPRADPALSAVVEGDTAEAIAALRHQLREGSPEADRLRGEIGVFAAFWSGRDDWSGSPSLSEVRGLLEGALDVWPAQPRYLAALAATFLQTGERISARRLADRALKRFQEAPGTLTRRELAWLFFVRAEVLRQEVREFRGLKGVPPSGAGLNTEGCAVDGGAFCLNWSNPRRFFGLFATAPDLGSAVAESRDAMLGEYRRAVEVDPTFVPAREALIADHLRERDWDQAQEEAGTWIRTDPSDPWAKVVLRAVQVVAGTADDTEPSLDDLVGDLDPGQRRAFGEIEPILRSIDAQRWAALDSVQRSEFTDQFWRQNDPLYLTVENERKEVFSARLVVADLMFGEPFNTRAGWTTPRGRILLRYGLPTRVWQVRRDDGLVVGARNLALTPDAVSAVSGGAAGGRWIFWNYDEEQPSFIFQRMLGQNRVRHMFASQSRAMEEAERKRAPLIVPAPYTDVGPVPFQLARFRDPDSGGFQIEIHGNVPESQDTAAWESGVFLFRTRGFVPVANARSPIDPPGDFDFRITGLTPGVYHLALEVSDSSANLGSVARGRVLLGDFPGDQLQTSDILVAEEVFPNADVPSSRSDLGVLPMRCVSMPKDRTLHFVFEIYGLSVEEGLAEYDIDVAATDEDEGGLMIRLLRGLADLVSSEGPTPGRLAFSRQAPSENGVAVEWFELELPENLDDEVTVTVRVTDRQKRNVVETDLTIPRDGCRRDLQ